ncbi:MAG: transposase [Deltaproteobacteria bacterium]|nr:transposase [Deltaproteobacteria bacterium]
MYALLFSSSSKTLLDAAQTKLKCQLAITSVLHTWTRDLRFHPHVHCIVSAGGLSLDSTAWVSSSGQYLLPVKLLSRLFRGKFLDGLTKLVMADEIPLELEDLRELKRELFSVEWGVYAKKPFAGPKAIFRYLGQYTHRVGISNYRIRSITKEAVVFSTKDGKVASLDPIEFIRRFLCHVLPRGFVKIRHYGLAASANLNGSMATARGILSSASSNDAEVSGRLAAPTRSWKELLEDLTGIDVDLCDSCRAQALTDRKGQPRTPNTS